MVSKSKELHDKEPKIKVAILEDNATLVKGMKMELDKPDIAVCVVSEDVDHFLEALKSTQPDIAIVDLRIWKDFEAGFLAIKKARGLSPETQYIVYTFYDDIENFHKGINLGIKAFVSKHIYEKPWDEIVRLVFGGGTYYGDLLQRYLAKVNGNSTLLELSDDEKAVPRGKLSKKEIEVLVHLDKGMSIQEIAIMLVVSQNTIKAHTKSIRGKLGQKTTADALRIFRLRRKDQDQI
jgi:DNA-binding NarL/FixJ family response regulator